MKAYDKFRPVRNDTKVRLAGYDMGYNQWGIIIAETDDHVVVKWKGVTDWCAVGETSYAPGSIQTFHKKREVYFATGTKVVEVWYLLIEISTHKGWQKGVAV